MAAGYTWVKAQVPSSTFDAAKRVKKLVNVSWDELVNQALQKWIADFPPGWKATVMQPFALPDPSETDKILAEAGILLSPPVARKKGKPR